MNLREHAVGQLAEALLYKPEGRGFDSPLLSIFIDIILSVALWHWGRLSLNRNEYQEYFLGVKAAGA
jgi:hypothetical protein